MAILGDYWILMMNCTGRDNRPLAIGKRCSVNEKDRGDEAVAPGYPAVEALRDIDVSAWEPAAVFRPAVLQQVEQGQGR